MEGGRGSDTHLMGPKHQMWIIQGDYKDLATTTGFDWVDLMTEKLLLVLYLFVYVMIYVNVMKTIDYLMKASICDVLK